VRGEVATLTINALIEPGADPAAAAERALRDLAALSAPEPPAPAPNGAAHILATEEFPSPDQWKAMVARAAADVRAGRFEKVVLARQLAVHAGAAFDPAAALRSLRAAYPSAYVFAVATNGRCFLGATPELLVRLDGRDVEATCLAGSIARGASAAEDERLARALLASAKDQVEHRIVVRSIQEALAPVCDDVVSEAAPRLLRVANVQHLYTPVRGRLAGDRCVLDLVERLHPTPAVGGYPRDVALAAIREREGFDRGWYAGPVGWVDRHGGGEFAVAIRSALVAGADALLYAGCGIVADSDPDTEYAETLPKLKPMLAGLRAED
jgi:isochorismate synthase